ncbi:MAG: flavin reductase family protein [Candidatus Lokiarchaeota archaeon]|nr:flavin reductase family protein [Candidatus Lokiarchaeota archaeon]
MEENRKEINPYEYMEYFMSQAAHVVSMDNNGKLNVMALLWKTIGELWMIPIITIAVSPARYTFELLTEGVPEFTINVPTEENVDTIDITGSYSGKNVDKFKKAGLEIIEGKRTKVPTIKDSLLSYECKIVHTCKSGRMASHSLFFGQILTAYASIKIINK